MQHTRDVEIKKPRGRRPSTTILISFINGWIIHTAWRKDDNYLDAQYSSVLVGPPLHYCVVSQSVLFVNKSPSLVHLPLKILSSFFNMCWLNYMFVLWFNYHVPCAVF